MFHVSPIACHPRTRALFLRRNTLLSSPLLPPTETTLFAASLLSSFLLSTPPWLSFSRLSTNSYRKSVRVFRSKLCLSVPSHARTYDVVFELACRSNRSVRGFYGFEPSFVGRRRRVCRARSEKQATATRFSDALDRRRFRGEAFAAIGREKLDPIVGKRNNGGRTSSRNRRDMAES